MTTTQTRQYAEPKVLGMFESGWPKARREHFMLTSCWYRGKTQLSHLLYPVCSYGCSWGTIPKGRKFLPSTVLSDYSCGSTFPLQWLGSCETGGLISVDYRNFAALQPFAFSGIICDCEKFKVSTEITVEIRIFGIGTPNMVVIVTFFSILWNIFNELLIVMPADKNAGNSRTNSNGKVLKIAKIKRNEETRRRWKNQEKKVRK